MKITLSMVWFFLRKLQVEFTAMRPIHPFWVVAVLTALFIGQQVPNF